MDRLQRGHFATDKWSVALAYLFEHATLHTEDGDTFFWLSLDCGPVKVAFEDVNRH